MESIDEKKLEEDIVLDEINFKIEGVDDIEDNQVGKFVDLDVLKGQKTVEHKPNDLSAVISTDWFFILFSFALILIVKTFFRKDLGQAHKSMLLFFIFSATVFFNFTTFNFSNGFSWVYLFLSSLFLIYILYYIKDNSKKNK